MSTVLCEFAHDSSDRLKHPSTAQPAGWPHGLHAEARSRAGADAIIGRMPVLGRIRPPAAHAARVGHRSLQPALPLLHAGGGLRLAAAGGSADASRRSIGWSGSSSALGVARVRLTGGEPLLRRDLPGLVARLAAPPRPRASDRSRPTASISPRGGGAAGGRARSRHRQPRHAATPIASSACRDRATSPAVLAGIAAAAAAFGTIKIDTVVIRGENDDELADARRLRRPRSAPRSASSNTWTSAARRAGRRRGSCRAREILARLERAFGAARRRSAAPTRRRPRATRCPADRSIGVIASTTDPFCADCDRARLTADGQLFTCLYATRGARSARPAARRRQRRRARGARSAASGRRGAIAAPRRASPSRAHVVHRPRRAEGAAAPRNAHARRLTPAACPEFVIRWSSRPLQAPERPAHAVAASSTDATPCV